MRTIRLLSAASAVALAISLAACGGGGAGGGSTLPTTGGSAPVTGEAATAKFTINIPAKASQGFKRHGQYISASTKSMTISTLSNNVATQAAEVDLTTASPNCSATSGALICTVKYLSTSGSNTYQIDMYDAIGGKGNKLSTGNVAATLAAGQDTVVPLVLNGVPVTAAVVLGSASLPVGNPGAVSVLVQAKDADQNLIIGPGDYQNAITLAVTGDKYGTLSLSTTSVTTPGQAVTLGYNGGSNVGATITPSAASLTATAATFNATGVVENLNQYFDTTNHKYLDPEDVGVAPTGSTLMPAGNAAVLGYWYDYNCCFSSYDVIAIADPKTGVSKVFAGDTTDPFNPPAVNSLTVPGATVVHGMNENIEIDEFDDYDDIAVGADGTIFYSTSFNSSSDPKCAGSESTGGIGALNPMTGTTVETSVKGYPGPIKVDTAGNAYWIEWTGSCAGVSMLGTDTYAIGKMTPSGTITETKFSAAGINWTYPSHYPADMNITPDGSQMFIIDDESPGGVAKVATATMSGAIVIQTSTFGAYPYGVAASEDGTALWFTDNDPEDEYFYGYESGASTFNQANLKEAAFPQPYAFGYNVAYADGSFWHGVEESSGSGAARVSNVSAGPPVTGFYPNTEVDGDSPEWSSVATGGGYVWMTDYDYYNVAAIQYGAPAAGTLSFAGRRAAGRGMMPSVQRHALPTSHHLVNPHAHGIPAWAMPH